MDNLNSAYIENYIDAFLNRHETGCYTAPDEVVHYIVENLVEEFGLYEHDANLDYDNLAVNAEIEEKESLSEDQQERYRKGDYLFETDNYVVFSW